MLCLLLKLLVGKLNVSIFLLNYVSLFLQIQQFIFFITPPLFHSLESLFDIFVKKDQWKNSLRSNIRG